MTRFGLPPGSIVVGVDGSEDAGRAVTWAAVQAALERRVLALVRSTDQVDECLADRSPAAGLLVIGRSASTGRARFLHASCAVAVLERARTAVAVVPEP